MSVNLKIAEPEKEFVDTLSPIATITAISVSAKVIPMSSKVIFNEGLYQSFSDTFLNVLRHLSDTSLTPNYKAYHLNW